MGNRKLNAALQQVVLTQTRVHPPAQAYLARKRAQGKSIKEAFWCLERHLARSVWKAMQEPVAPLARLPRANGTAASAAATAEPTADACPELHAERPAHHQEEPEEKPEADRDQHSQQVVALALQNIRDGKPRCRAAETQ